MIQVLKIFANVDVSVAWLVKKFQPIIAPTMAWEVDTGRPDLVITKTENPAESAVIKAPGRAVIAPNLPNVWDVPAPEITAPSITKIEQIIAALR